MALRKNMSAKIRSIASVVQDLKPFNDRPQRVFKWYSPKKRQLFLGRVVITFFERNDGLK